MKNIAQTQNFSELIDSDYIYIDKTEQIFNLLKNRRAFISRPRRFGKSLMLDTIGTLFEYGVEPYFKDTWIYDKWTDKKYLVLRLSFLKFSCSDYNFFCEDFDACLARFAQRHNLEYVSKDLPMRSMQSLLGALELSNNRVVILMDEYDAQLTANINNPELYEKFCGALRELYGVMKGESCIRFLGITGVTRLKDVSIFSVGSDIIDVSYASEVAKITGFTRDELKKYYLDYINLAVSLENEISVEEVTAGQQDVLLDKLAEEYNGYCFDETNKEKVYSTWSVNSFFLSIYKKGYVSFGDYWYDNGGMPTILANYMQSHRFDMNDYKAEDVYVGYDALVNPSSLLDMDQKVLMCQTGYLTLDSEISGYLIRLKSPNKEIKRALARVVSTKIFNSYINKSKSDYQKIFYEANPEQMVSELNKMFNSLSYERYPIENEKAVQDFIQVFMMGGNLPVSTEIKSAVGRADIILEYDKRRLVFELKFAKTEAECEKKLHEAIEQIKTKRYGNTLPAKPVLKIALVFNGDCKVRQFTHYSVVE